MNPTAVMRVRQATQRSRGAEAPAPPCLENGVWRCCAHVAMARVVVTSLVRVHTHGHGAGRGQRQRRRATCDEMVGSVVRNYGALLSSKLEGTLAG